ncbi:MULTISPECIES: hypothetical protein [unclassified Polaribacter]|uniref:hypothetical protein n=1 Tax=unclassified Polaribacter TaxID=196858 RepID=UPI0011BDADB8|nr:MULTISPECIES: hypothetical protein [unclassified Polaribacter]TXD51805.1 hypothetical protein ES043_10405 [Polaribacter sp. IC063]TXD59167.1 hypothetical protein ES044_10480 [Polaribacter sp. IC066]
MKKICYIAILFLCIHCSKDDRPENPTTNSNQIEFIKTFGGSKNDVLQSIVKTSDGGYATLGYTQSNNFDITTKTDESFDFWVMKFSSDDAVLWSKTYGGSDDDRGADIIATSDGGFALLGYSKSANNNLTTNAGAQDFWILKISGMGTILWQKTFGYAGADTGIALLQTQDNGYVVTGVLDVTASNGQGNSKSAQKHAGGDIWVLKLNNFGDTEWSQYYGGSFTDSPFGIEETEDNSYIIAASSDSEDFNISNNKGSYDFWILKIASDGNLIWEKSFGGSEIDEARAITKTNDGNFLIVGDTRSSDKDVSNNNGGADLWMLKIASDGNLIWEKTIGATSFDVARSISKTDDHGFIIAGNSRSSDAGFTNNGQNDAWVLKVDTNGNTVWQKFIGGSENDVLFDAVQVNNQSIIAVGESISANGDIPENKGFSDALIIKIK